MSIHDELALLKQGLKTEIELAMAGECRESVVLLLRENRLPMARITDCHGKVTNKVVSLVDLLRVIDSATTISQLRREATRTTDLPPLPRNTLLAGVTERPEGRSFTVTGYVEPDTYVVLIEEGGENHTFDIPFPHLVYRAVYDEQRAALSALSIAVCVTGASTAQPSQPEDRSGLHPEARRPGGERRNMTNSAALYSEPAPTADSPIQRYPLSNVYHSFGGISEGVCWPGMRQLSMELCQVPEEAVKRFVREQNNADLYGRGLSHNAPYTGYAPFLENIEREGGIHEDYLIPTGATVRDLHYQQRPQT